MNNNDKKTMLEKIRNYLIKRIDKGVERRKLVYNLAYKNKTKN